MKPQFINLGDRLRSLRRNSQKSQHALADECWALGLPITRDMIASWEISRAEIPAQLIPFIAYTLNAEVADLLPDLRTSRFADLPRILATVGAPRKSAEPQKPSTQAPRSANQPALVISEPAKSHRRGNAIKCVFLAENETSPLDALILSETRVKLMTLVRTLDHRNRQALLLRYYSGLKIREIATRLNLPIGNVQARIYRACEQLGRLLIFHPQLRSLRKELRDQFPPLEGSWERSPHLTAGSRT